MNNFEKNIALIDQSISIQKEDREAYTKDFDAIRDYLFQTMKKVDSVFEKVYAGPSLFGSYLENLRLHKPDEFDVHFLIKIPFYEQIELEQDPNRPGYVRLSLAKPLQSMRLDTNLTNVYNQFKKFVTAANLLLRNEFQDWLEKIIETALRTYGNKVSNDAGNDQYILNYKKLGTAHNVIARSNQREISMDFVPAFRFNAPKNWFLERPFPIYVKEKFYFAVPKPAEGTQNGINLTFSVCVPQIEKDLILRKYNLKPSMRLFKCIRDKIQDGHLIKSYFIRNIYLLENEKQNDQFWQRPTGAILLHMLNKLLGYLDQRRIPFYWCPSTNMLEGKDHRKICDLTSRFRIVADTLEKYSRAEYIDYERLKLLFEMPKKPLKLKLENV